jgi:COMPASS component SWD1
MGAPVWGATLHPENHLVFAASLYEDEPKYVDLSGSKPEIKVIPTTKEGEETSGKQLTLVVTFTRRGDYILSGTSKGVLNVIDTKTLSVVHSTKLAHGNIKQLMLNSSGRSLVLNSSDRVVRVVQLPDMGRTAPEEWEFDVEHKFQDVVNRLQWNSVAMSNSGEYVLATTYESSHDIYMWETSMGSLVKIYEGPKEELFDIEFHPTKPAIAATGLDTGVIYLWMSTIPQKWSALAPDFEELEENIDYMEREDEFDLFDEEDQLKREQDGEEEDVDLVTVERGRGDIDDAFIIPVNLDLNVEPPISDDDD